MDHNIRNFKDFLQIYNNLSETCFSSCVDNLNSRALESQEQKCVDDCSQKFITLNHRFMAIYVEAQQLVVNRRIQEVEAAEQARLAEEQAKQAQEQAKLAEEQAKQAEEQAKLAKEQATKLTNTTEDNNSKPVENKPDPSIPDNTIPQHSKNVSVS